MVFSTLVEHAPRENGPRCVQAPNFAHFSVVVALNLGVSIKRARVDLCMALATIVVHDFCIACSGAIEREEATMVVGSSKRVALAWVLRSKSAWFF